MKRTLLFTFALLLLAIPIQMKAYTVGETVWHEDLAYKVLNITDFNVAFIGARDSKVGAITIPSSFDDGKGTTFHVTQIGGGGAKCKNITAVTLPETIEKFDDACFGDANLTALTIPSNVKTIVHSAFYNIGTKPKITVASGNQHFSSDTNGCLYSKDGKELYSVPSALNPTEGIYNVPESVEKIYYSAFHQVTGLRKLVLPKNLQYVETGFPTITPSDDLEEFDIAAGGTSLYRVIGGVLFKDAELVAYPRAKATTTYQVPNGITSIAPRAIDKCKLMETIDLNQVTKLNNTSIYAAKKLKSITLPKNLEKENVVGAIASCQNIEEYKAPPGGCVNFEVADGVVYSKDKSMLYFFPPRKNVSDGKYTVDPSVKTIAKYAFAGCSTITDLTISDNVEKIEESAFNDVYNMSKLTFKETSKVATIEKFAFGWCQKLKEVMLPSSLTEVTNIFNACRNLEVINVPDNSKLTTIKKDAFRTNEKLREFNFKGSCTLEKIEESAFYGLTKLEKIVFPKTVTDIEKNAFAGCSSLKTAEFAPDATIGIIGQGAFADCGLTAISIPNSVTKLDREAFRSCSALTVVNVSENLTDISSEAFKYCENLTDINVDKKNTRYSSVDGYLLTKNKETLVLFPHGKAHAKFTLLPPSITKICDFAFLEFLNLTIVIIPNKVTEIGDRAFSLCKNLKDIAFLCEEPISPDNIDQRPNHKSFDDGTAGTTNMPANINIYVRSDLKAQYDAIPFYKDNFKSIQPSFVEDGNEYLQVAATVVDLLSVKSTQHTFVIPEKTTTHGNLEVKLIGDYAFQNASSKIKEVVVKNYVEYVGAKAFMTNIADNSSTIENVFFLSNAPTKKMLSTTRFELDETNTNYKEFASTTNIYVKKSVVENYKTEWKKQMWDTGTGTMQDSPADYQFYNQIDYKIKGTPALTNKLYSTFSREFDVDFGDTDDSGNRLFWDAAKNCPKVIAFTSGEKIGNSIIRMKSINLGEDISKDGLYIPANTGVVLKAIDGTLPADFYYRIGEDDKWSYGGANILKPVTMDAKDISDTEDGKTNFYVTGGKAFRVSQAQQFKNEGKLTIGVHKAYINIDVSGGAKISLLFDDNETTGIEEINSADNTASKTDDTYYNLNGQKVSKPTRGIYIHNGKKVVVK